MGEKFGIGYQVKKYLNEKAEAAAEALTETPETEATDDARPTRKSPTMADVMAQFGEILQELRAANSPEQKEAALTQADILQQILVKTRPENTAAPMIGVYSTPKGERDDPKPALKCRIFWCGFDLKTDTLTPIEIDLLNRLDQIECQVTKADGARIPFKVTAVRDGALKLERLEVWFPCKGADRHNHGSAVSYMRQALGDQQMTSEEMVAEIARLKADLQAVPA